MRRLDSRIGVYSGSPLVLAVDRQQLLLGPAGMTELVDADVSVPEGFEGETVELVDGQGREIATIDVADMEPEDDGRLHWRQTLQVPSDEVARFDIVAQSYVEPSGDEDVDGEAEASDASGESLQEHGDATGGEGGATGGEGGATGGEGGATGDEWQRPRAGADAAAHRG